MLFAALIFCSTVCLLCCASIDLVGGQAGVTGSSANRMKITLHNFLVGADHRRGVRGGCGQRRLQSQWRILVGPGSVQLLVDTDSAPSEKEHSANSEEELDQTFAYGPYSPLLWPAAAGVGTVDDEEEGRQGYALAYPPF